MEFKAYRHRAPTRARKLTEADYTSRQGIIETLEGPQPFSAGDYLARNAKGEWPIKHETLAKNYIQITPEDEVGAEQVKLLPNVWTSYPFHLKKEGDLEATTTSSYINSILG